MVDGEDYHQYMGKSPNVVSSSFAVTSVLQIIVSMQLIHAVILFWGRDIVRVQNSFF